MYNNYKFIVMLCLFTGLVVTTSYAQADEAGHGKEHHAEELTGGETSSQRHEPAHEEESSHEHSSGFKIMGMSFGVISGILTITSLLTTFTIGMLRHFGKKKLNMKLHHYAAYTTVTLACIHAVYNLVTH